MFGVNPFVKKTKQKKKKQLFIDCLILKIIKYKNTKCIHLNSTSYFIHRPLTAFHTWALWQGAKISKLV